MRLASTQVIPVESNLPISSTDQLEVEFEEDVIPRNHSALTITDLLNPIQLTSTIQKLELLDYDSDSESSQSEPISKLTINDDAMIANDNECAVVDSKASTVSENESAMRTDDKDPTNLLSQKRSRYFDWPKSDSNEDSSDDPDICPRKYTKSGEGTSKSAVASRLLRESVKKGSFIINEEKFQTWRSKILQSDPNSEFDAHDLWKVRHSVCGEWKRVKEPYDAARWNKHVKECEEEMKKKKIVKTPSLFSMGWFKVEKKNTVKIEPPSQVPCPGITEADDARITKYLKRTGVLGGGGRSLTVISNEKFGKTFTELKEAKSKKTVVDTQMHEWKWRNDHGNLRVYSTSCQKLVNSRSTDSKRPKPCLSCVAVLQSRGFKNAIRVPTPSDKNYKFVNFRFRNKLLGRIFARTIGVKHIIEDEVWRILSYFLIYLFIYFRIPDLVLLCVMQRVLWLVNTIKKCSMVSLKPLLRRPTKKREALGCKTSHTHLHGRNFAISLSFIVHELIKFFVNTCQCPAKEVFGMGSFSNLF